MNRVRRQYLIGLIGPMSYIRQVLTPDFPSSEALNNGTIGSDHAIWLKTVFNASDAPSNDSTPALAAASVPRAADSRRPSSDRTSPPLALHSPHQVHHRTLASGLLRRWTKARLRRNRTRMRQVRLSPERLMHQTIRRSTDPARNLHAVLGTPIRTDRKLNALLVRFHEAHWRYRDAVLHHQVDGGHSPSHTFMDFAIGDVVIHHMVQPAQQRCDIVKDDTSAVSK